jgi:hypothetical protein
MTDPRDIAEGLTEDCAEVLKAVDADRIVWLSDDVDDMEHRGLLTVEREYCYAELTPLGRQVAALLEQDK